jgi:ribosome maturation factor RimP
MGQVELIEQAVTGLGYELVDFETSPRGRLLRVFIDKPEGVTVDDCAAVSDHLTRLFMVENVDYDRPLKKPADWQRFAGQQAQFKLRVPVGNQRNFVGEIAGLRGESVAMIVEGKEREFPLAGIEKARLVPRISFKED